MTHNIIREAARKKLARLTQRETDILRLVSFGNTNREISAALDIGPETVKSTLKVIFRKLHVRNRVQAAVLAALHL